MQVEKSTTIPQWGSVAREDAPLRKKVMEKVDVVSRRNEDAWREGLPSASSVQTTTVGVPVNGVSKKKRVTWASGAMLQRVEFIETRTELSKMFYQETRATSAVEFSDNDDEMEGVEMYVTRDMDAERINVQSKFLYLMQPDMQWRQPNFVRIPVDVEAAVYSGVEKSMLTNLASASTEVFPDPEREVGPTEAALANLEDAPPLIPLEREVEEDLDEEEDCLAPINEYLSAHAAGAKDQQKDLIMNMTEETLWHSPSSILVNIDSEWPIYSGSEYGALEANMVDTVEMFPRSGSSPHEPTQEPTADDALTPDVPLLHKDLPAQEESECPSSVSPWLLLFDCTRFYSLRRRSNIYTLFFQLS